MYVEEAVKRGGLIKLSCDNCGKHIGWVYDFDLNGNYFYCDECRNAAQEKFERGEL